MKNKTILAILFLLTFAIASCSKDEGADGAGKGASSGDYPMTTCVVSGEPLGSMGEPVVIEHKGTTVKFCCDSCLPKFNKDPESYVAKVKGS